MLSKISESESPHAYSQVRRRKFTKFQKNLIKEVRNVADTHFANGHSKSKSPIYSVENS